MRMWCKIALIVRFIYVGGDATMATIYVTLIVRGYRSYSDVPSVLKPEVKRQLDVLELGALAV